MPLGTPPADIYHNNQWYSRSGQPIGGAPFRISIAAPSGVAPSGTVGANGAITLGTALSRNYLQGIFLYFPAGALFTGSAAGSYWCVMTTTTAGTAFNNILQSVVAPPSLLVPISDAGPGVFTGAGTTARTIATLVVPGGSLGPSGELVLNTEIAWFNSASAKIFAYTFAGNAILTATRGVGSHDSFTNRWKNLGVETRGSFIGASESTLLGGAAETQFAIDTSADTTLQVTLSSAVATEPAVLQGLSAVVYYGS